MISKVPRPLGELTHPCWSAEDVAFVVLAAIASLKYKLEMMIRCAIAAQWRQYKHWASLPVAAYIG